MNARIVPLGLALTAIWNVLDREGLVTPEGYISEDTLANIGQDFLTEAQTLAVRPSPSVGES